MIQALRCWYYARKRERLARKLIVALQQRDLDRFLNSEFDRPVPADVPSNERSRP